MQVNRYLTDKAMDRVDHALGRPLNPIGESYRNYYATGGALADEMAASPYWQEGGRDQRMRYFHVTASGRAALASHLREIGDRHRAFAVTFDGHTRVIPAVSASKARYSHYLDISDVLPDLTFEDYCRRTSVRAASNE